MAYEEVFIRIETALDALMAANPDFFYSLDGDPIRRWKNLYQIVEDLARSLGSAAIEIFIILGIVFRSIRMGIISVIPNVLPLAAAATWMAFHQATAGDCECLRLHCMFGDCGRRYDPFSIALSIGDASRFRSRCGHHSRFRWRWIGYDHDHHRPSHRIRFGLVQRDAGPPSLFIDGNHHIGCRALL